MFFGEESFVYLINLRVECYRVGVNVVVLSWNK